MSDQTKLKEVFAGEYWLADVIKQLLEDNHIPAFLNNQYLGTVAPYLADAGGMPHVTIVVNETEAAKALRLIDDYQNGSPADEIAD
ncbi:DUF2007 domain-containing protein [Mucilaginibacter sp. RS28]|uniref:DUF2007 domain-containing protein n=1 Tax=Mucilaginibacter straminoryzae TaxID=2932774 RepID=A0A9X1X526_9SPHI|nr:DUF2007 domain-containing protein [Mucilaginibacter straminoryzae]MCJ8210545.1 DUF2007 domain-containing protein [Mucilaginibacter straminoryzae]